MERRYYPPCWVSDEASMRLCMESLNHSVWQRVSTQRRQLFTVPVVTTVFSSLVCEWGLSRPSKPFSECMGGGDSGLWGQW